MITETTGALVSGCIVYTAIPPDLEKETMAANLAGRVCARTAAAAAGRGGGVCVCVWGGGGGGGWDLPGTARGEELARGGVLPQSVVHKIFVLWQMPDPVDASLIPSLILSEEACSRGR